ncbi:MAG: hypothetical protein O3A55_00500 [Bacteroidetes bacterium]|nr:hypothetical protein [Bacteroidota bacterium]
MKKFFIVLIFTSSLLFPQEEQTKTFYLEDGTKLVGTVVSENDSLIILKTSFGEVKINKIDLTAKKESQESVLLQKQIRDDLEWDFTVYQTLYSQFHGATLTIITDNPVGLLVNGGGYFAASALASRLNDLSRINVESSNWGHLNGIAQGLLLGSILTEENNDGKIVMLMGSLGGLGHAYYSYTRANEVPEYVSAFTHFSEFYAPFWTTSALITLGVEEPSFKSMQTIWLVSSLSANYWAPKLIGERNLSLGGFISTQAFHFAALSTGFVIPIVLETDNEKLFFASLLSSSLFGLYYGLKDNEGNNLTFEEGRFVDRMTLAGATTGFGLGILVQSLNIDEDTGFKEKEMEFYMKVTLALTSAGAWGGYFYGKNSVLKDKNISSNWNLQFNPENYLISSNLDYKNPFTPKHIPIINFKYSF